MTRLFWILLALFPLPLVVLLAAGPPDLFERERIHAAHDIAVSLDAAEIDWKKAFGQDSRIFVGQLLPEKAAEYEHFGIAIEYAASPDDPVLIAPTGGDTDLRYRLAAGCWEVPDRLTLLETC